MKLSKKSATRIASLYNGYYVSMRMLSSAITEERLDNLHLWRQAMDDYAKSLHDEFNIVVIGYDKPLEHK